MIEQRASIIGLLSLFALGTAIAGGEIDVSDCALNGFPLGGTSDEMRRIFGNPLPPEQSEDLLFDDYGGGYRYPGLVFLRIGSSNSVAYRVSDPKYQLVGGIGVGSRKAEVEAQLGSGIGTVDDGVETLSYRIRSIDGILTRQYLDFTIVGGVVSEFGIDIR